MKYALLVALLFSNVFAMQKSQVLKKMIKSKKINSNINCCACMWLIGDSICIAGKIVKGKIAEHSWNFAGYTLEKVSHGLDPQRKYKTE